MTNNPTIDGVSRELMQKIDDLLYIMTGHDSYPKLVHKYGKEWWAPINELRGEICTLLDAPDICPTCDSRDGCPDCKPEPEPVVERQEPVSSQVPVLRAMAANYRNGHQWDFLDGEAVNKAADEITRQQSTIAQLQARIADLSGQLQDVKRERHKAWNERDNANARIAELESGRVEPVAYTDLKELERLGSISSGYMSAILYRDPGALVAPLYTAPPAPVAVVPDGWKLVPVEPTELMNRAGDEDYSWNVAKIYRAMIGAVPAIPCLDAIAALNEGRK